MHYLHDPKHRWTEEEKARLAALEKSPTLSNYPNLLELFPNRTLATLQTTYYNLRKKARNGSSPEAPPITPAYLEPEPTPLHVSIEPPIDSQSPAEDPNSKRIDWTQQEIEALAIGLLNLRINQPLEDFGDLVNTVQHQLLPRHRWRNLAIKDRYAAVLSKFRKKYYAFVERATTEPDPEIIQIEVPAPAPEIEELIKNAPTELLTGVLLGRLFTKFDDLKTSMDRIPAPDGSVRPPKPVHIPLHEKKDRKIRISITGVLADVFQAVEMKTRHLPIRLHHQSNDVSKPNLPTSTEYAIISKFGSHHIHEGAKRQIGHERCFFIRGGVESFLEQIEEICRKEGVIQ